MARRKRAAVGESGEGAPSKLRRTNKKEDTVVISDSDDEEEKCQAKPSSRAGRSRAKENRVQDMTEDEMLNWAMRLSEQEADTVAKRQQLEDNAMKKAIEESLHASDSKAAKDDPKPTSPAESHKAQRSVSFETSLHRRKLSYPSQGEDKDTTPVDNVIDGAETVLAERQEGSPLPLMPDLSQTEKTCSQSSSLSSANHTVPCTSNEQDHGSSQQTALDASPSDSETQVDVASPTSPLSSKSQNTAPHLSSLSQPTLRLERLSQDLLGKCQASGFLSCSQDDTLNLTCAIQSQASQQNCSPLPRSPVFTKTDPKSSEDVPSLKETRSTLGISDNRSLEDQENLPETSSHKGLSLKSEESQHGLEVTTVGSSSRKRHSSDSTDMKISEAVGSKQMNQKRLKEGFGKTDQSAEDSLNPGRLLLLETQSLPEISSNITLRWTDDDDGDDGDMLKVDRAPSPVFPREQAAEQSQSPGGREPPQRAPPLPRPPGESAPHAESKPRRVRNKFTFPGMYAPRAETAEPRRGPLKSEDGGSETGSEGKGTVHYYWGIPFCPQGQDPDAYTRVILTQLEVYEKSLKEAQRGLLRKAEWGLPVVPGPAERPLLCRKRRKRPRPTPRLEDDEDEEDGEDDGGKSEQELRGENERGKSRSSVDDRAIKPSQSYVVVSSPEAQEKSPPLFAREESDEASKLRKCSVEEISDETQIQLPVEEEARIIEDKRDEDEVNICPETQMMEDNTPELMVTSPAQPESRVESDGGMEVDGMGGEDERMDSQEGEEVDAEMVSEAAASSPPGPAQSVDCPMCMRPFPLAKIEMHAAYCDGAPELLDSQSRVFARSKRTQCSDTKKEKCYVCRRMFSLKEYRLHVEQCVQRGQEERGNMQGNGLLSALDQTERASFDYDVAGPSEAAVKTQSGLAERVGADPEAGARDPTACLGYRISSSPIKSFTPISEATDCLIDFKQQGSSKTSQRLGRKRKFKR